MGRETILVILLVLICTGLTGCITEEEPKGADLLVGDRLPSFRVTLDDGRTFGSELLRTGDGIIVFFSTECPDCQRELPGIQRLYDSLTPERRLRMACIAREEDAGRIAAYWRENGLTLPYSPQPDRRVYNLFATYTIPRLYRTHDGVITEIRVETDLTDKAAPEGAARISSIL